MGDSCGITARIKPMEQHLMTPNETAQPATFQTPGRRIWIAFAVLTLAAVTGVVLVFAWVSDERDRALRIWQDKLTIVAESLAAAVAGWVAGQQEVISALGRDDVVRLYLADILAQDPNSNPNSDDALAQAQYLANLLDVTAGRTGFSAPLSGADVPANVARVGRAGIVILDSDMNAVVASRGLPEQTPELRGFVAGRIGADVPAMFGPFAGADGGTVSMAFTAPISGIQDDRKNGLIVGVRPVGTQLFELLRQPGATEVTAEAMLLDTWAAAVRYLSPLADGTVALARSRALDTRDLAAAYAVQNPGGFGIFRDYRDIRVLVASRVVPGTEWVIAYKVDYDEALGAAEARLTRLLVILLLAIALVAAAIVAAWRHGASRRAAESAARSRDLAARYEAQAKFIRKLTDTQPNTIFMVDADDRVTFANARLARLVGASQTEDVVGKTLAGVFGPGAARRYARGVREAFAEESSVSQIDRVQGNDERDASGERVLQAQFVYLPASELARASVLIVEQDITDAISERERNERLLEQLSVTLLAIVDRRDPYAAHQSARVADVASALAQEMALDEVLVDTVGKSASLMNIGKILVSRSILMKNGPLTEAESDKVSHALAAGVELLADVEFAGPVVETLRQTRAQFDGSGDPQGLAGADILVTARIVAVANAFVGMVSPRAHRPGMTFDAAVQVLLDDSGSRFDLGVVGALINRLDNRGGRQDWSDFSAPPPGIQGVVN